MDKKQKIIIIISLIVVTFIAFGPILQNDFVNYDDYVYITDNQQVKSGISVGTIKWAFGAVVGANWHPLTLLSHALDWSLFGQWAGGHHLVSLLFHIGAVLFLFLFLSKTTQSLWPSAVVAALFALHPLRVESVAWASERKDVLSMFFGMAALYAYAFYVEDKKISKYIMCLLMFVLSLLSKPMLVTLPFILLLLDYWPLQRWQNNLYQQQSKQQSPSAQLLKKEKVKKKIVAAEQKNTAVPTQSNRQVIKPLLLEKIPFFFLTIISSVVTLWAQNHGGAVAAMHTLLFSDRVINALVSYVAYLVKIFWPVNLAVFYPYQSVFPAWQIFAAVFILIGLTVLVTLSLKKAPFLFVGWFWYVGTLVPVIGLVQVGIQTMADRYTYLPSIGISIMLIWGILYLVPKEKMRKIFLLPVACVLLFILTILTWQQCGHWKHSVSLWSHAANVTEDNYFAHDALGNLLFVENKKDEAIAHLHSAIKINPFWDNAYNMLGVAQVAQGKKEEAIARFLEAIRINPYNEKAQVNLGISLEEQGKNEEAKSHYYKALEINPANADAHYNLANLFIKKREMQQAVHHYREAIKSNPDHLAARYNLADILAKQGKTGEAIEHFREVARINPSSFQALNNLGVMLENQQRHDEAIHYYRLAMPLEPNNPRLHFNLGVALGNKGDLEQAIEHFHRAVELKPDYQDARRALKIALGMKNKN